MASQASSSSRKPPKVKQACDCCHARKIRCDGTQPCNNCQITALPCTYLSIPKKKGPKGPSKRTPRAILKMQMRQESAKSPENHFINLKPTSSPTLSSPTLEINKSLDLANGFIPSPHLSLDVAEQYIEIFFKHKYPVTPILHRDTLYATLKSFNTSPETYALVASLCAAMMSLTQQDQSSISSPGLSSNDGLLTTEFFISEAKRARQFREYVEKPLLSDVQMSFFLFAALFDGDRHNSAWFHLREAMTMLQLLRLHEEDTYGSLDAVEALFSRRTFWLLFLTERAYALQRHRPLTLQRTIALPTVSPDDPDAPIISGFLDLVSLFQNFDDDFVSLWNKSSRTSTHPMASTVELSVSSAQLSALQSILAVSIPDVSKRTETQQADLLISRDWLRLMVWQLAVTKGLLSSSSKDESMSFIYPVAIARDVVTVSRPFKPSHFDPHGPGILEKLFDIGCSLADVLQLHPNAPGVMNPGYDVGPKDYLLEMLRLCQTILGGSSRYVSLLAAKADECFHVGPRAIDNASPMSNGRVVEVNAVDPMFQDLNMDDDDEESAGPYFGAPSGEMFDYGALSDVTSAWLGSISNEEFVDLGWGVGTDEELFVHD